MNFAWNTTKIKSIYLSPEGGRTRVEIPAIEILRDPNRHQFESIIAAMTVTIAELVSIQEQQAARLADAIKKMQETKNEATEEISRSSSGRNRSVKQRRGKEESGASPE